MLKIWGRKNSSNVQKVLWTCAELEVPFERVDWGGPFGGNQDPAYLAMNPNGLVPTVKDGDLVIWESNTIMRYLCATRGGASLHPADPAQRTAVERWMDWQLQSLGAPMSTMLLGYYRTAPEKRDPAALETARKRAIELWAMVERQLEGGPYMAGASFTLADITLGAIAGMFIQSSGRACRGSRRGTSGSPNGLVSPAMWQVPSARMLFTKS